MRTGRCLELGNPEWRGRLGAVVAALLLAMLIFCPAPASAASLVDNSQMSIPVGEGELVRLPGPAASVFIANPDIADIQVPSPGAVFVMGKKAGTTTLYAIGDNNTQLLKRRIVVRHNLDELQSILQERFPSLHLNMASAPGSLMVSGIADNAEDVAAIENTLKPFLAKEENLINNVQLHTPTQVHLKVRFCEVSRDITQNLGISWDALAAPTHGHFLGGLFNGRQWFDQTSSSYILSDTNFSALMGYTAGGYNLQAMIDALDQEGLITMMAEPNLTAISGQTATFLAGGEFPIPVAQQNSNAITVVFKPFGISLAFTPTVLSSDRISLLVRPEVSAIDANNSVTTNGFSVPGLSVRRVETTVELGSGQSFVLGGLLADDMTEKLSKLPGIGSVPVLGKLFSSQKYMNNKSELVVLVTAYVVQPLDGRGLRTPLQSLKSVGDIEYIAQQRVGIDPLAPGTPRLMGNAGFVY